MIYTRTRLSYLYFVVLLVFRVMPWSNELVIALIEILQAARASWRIQYEEYRDGYLKFDRTSKTASHFKTNADRIVSEIIASIKKNRVAPENGR